MRRALSVVCKVSTSAMDFPQYLESLEDRNASLPQWDVEFLSNETGISVFDSDAAMAYTDYVSALPECEIGLVSANDTWFLWMDRREDWIAYVRWEDPSLLNGTARAMRAYLDARDDPNVEENEVLCYYYLNNKMTSMSGTPWYSDAVAGSNTSADPIPSWTEWVSSWACNRLLGGPKSVRYKRKELIYRPGENPMKHSRILRAAQRLYSSQNKTAPAPGAYANVSLIATVTRGSVYDTLFDWTDMKAALAENRRQTGTRSMGDRVSSVRRVFSDAWEKSRRWAGEREDTVTNADEIVWMENERRAGVQSEIARARRSWGEAPKIVRRVWLGENESVECDRRRSIGGRGSGSGRESGITEVGWGMGRRVGGSELSLVCFDDCGLDDSYFFNPFELYTINAWNPWKSTFKNFRKSSNSVLRWWIPADWMAYLWAIVQTMRSWDMFQGLSFYIPPNEEEGILPFPYYIDTRTFEGASLGNRTTAPPARVGNPLTMCKEMGSIYDYWASIWLVGIMRSYVTSLKNTTLLCDRKRGMVYLGDQLWWAWEIILHDSTNCNPEIGVQYMWCTWAIGIFLNVAVSSLIMALSVMWAKEFCIKFDFAGTCSCKECIKPID